MSNSNRTRHRVVGAALFVVLFLVGDLFVYRALFPLYDKLNHVYALRKPADILIVGSSSIQWGVDGRYLAQQTGARVRTVAIAGGDVDFRLAVAKEFLRRHKGTRPRLILFHTDSQMYRRDRYHPDAYLPLEGYYHRGILQAYLRKQWKEPRQSLFKRAFRSYTLNSQFFFIMGKLYDRIVSPVRRAWRRGASSLTNTQSLKPPSRKGAPKGETGSTTAHIPATRLTAARARQLEAEWRKRYAVVNRHERLDPHLQASFHRAVRFLRRAGVAVAFVETPIYYVGRGKLDPEVRREVLKATRESGFSYFRIPPERMERDIRNFFDASHLNDRGRRLFTDYLIGELIAKKLISLRAKQPQ